MMVDFCNVRLCSGGPEPAIVHTYRLDLLLALTLKNILILVVILTLIILYPFVCCTSSPFCSRGWRPFRHSSAESLTWLSSLVYSRNNWSLVVCPVMNGWWPSLAGDLHSPGVLEWCRGRGGLRGFVQCWLDWLCQTVQLHRCTAGYWRESIWQMSGTSFEPFDS